MVCPGNMCMATLHKGDNDVIIIIIIIIIVIIMLEAAKGSSNYVTHVMTKLIV